MAPEVEPCARGLPAELEPDDEGHTKLTETFDLSTAVFPPAMRVMGYPKRHLLNVARSVANVRDHFAGS